MTETVIPVSLRIGTQNERTIGRVDRGDDAAEFQRRVAALLREAADEIELRSGTPDG